VVHPVGIHGPWHRVLADKLLESPPLIIRYYLFTACRWPRTNPKETCAGPLPNSPTPCDQHRSRTFASQYMFYHPRRNCEAGDTKRLRVSAANCVVCLQNEVLARTYGKASRCTSISQPPSHRVTAIFRLPHPLVPADYFSSANPLPTPSPSQPSGNVTTSSALLTAIATWSSANFLGHN
jgi:hypothetical protein